MTVVADCSFFLAACAVLAPPVRAPRAPRASRCV